MFTHFLLGTTQRHRQGIPAHFAHDFPQHHFVELNQIIENKHFLLDGQELIGLALFQVAGEINQHIFIEFVENRHQLALDPGFSAVSGLGEHIFTQCVFDILNRIDRQLVHAHDALDQIGGAFGPQQRQYLRCDVRPDSCQDDRDRLVVFLLKKGDQLLLVQIR